MQASDTLTSQLLHYEAKCVQRRFFQCGLVPLRSGIKGMELPPANIIELLFLSLVVEVLQGKMCQNSLPSGGGRSHGAKISGGRGHPLSIY